MTKEVDEMAVHGPIVINLNRQLSIIFNRPDLLYLVTQF